MRQTKTLPPSSIHLLRRVFAGCRKPLLGDGSGRNTARAALEFGGSSTDFPVGLSPTPIAHVSASPPLIPDGRISRVRLAAMAFPSRTFPFKPKLKCLPTYAPCLNGLISNSTFLFVSTILQHSVWPVFLSNARHLPRAPLPAQGVTSYGVVSMHDIREHYLSFIAHTGSCVRP